MRRNISGYSGGAESSVTAALSGSGMRMPGGGRGRGWRGTRPGMSSERCRRGAKLLHAAGTGGRGVPQRVPGRAGQVSVSGLPAAAGVDPAPLCLCCCSVLVCRPAAPGGGPALLPVLFGVSVFPGYLFLQYLFPGCCTSLPPCNTSSSCCSTSSPAAIPLCCSTSSSHCTRTSFRHAVPLSHSQRPLFHCQLYLFHSRLPAFPGRV